MVQIEEDSQHLNKPGMLEMFLTFLRIGATAFGGPAMAQFIRKECVLEKKWIDDKTFSEGLAFCQAIPGSIAIQAAAYVGLKLYGIPGAVLCFAAFGIPAYIVMALLTSVYFVMRQYPQFNSLFTGFNILAICMIFYSAYAMGKTYTRKLPTILIALASFIMFYYRINAILVMILSAIASIIIYWNEKEEAKQVTCSHHHVQKNYYFYWALLVIAGALLLNVIYLMNKTVFDVSFRMIKVSVMAYGGGFVAQSIMYNEFVIITKTLSKEQFLDGIALSSITPGPVIVAATFIGYKVGGVLGSLMATIYVFLPSLLINLAAAPFYEKVIKSPIPRKALKGMLASFVGLLFSVLLHFDIVSIITSPRKILFTIAVGYLVFRGKLIWALTCGGIVAMIIFK